IRFCFALHLGGRLIVRWAPFPSARVSLEVACPNGMDPEATGQFWQGLNPQEQSVLEERLLQGVTLRQVGSARGVSHERARQIERRALDKLLLPASLARLGYCLTRALRELPSYRLVDPEEL